jgi:hypothetical protein
VAERGLDDQGSIPEKESHFFVGCHFQAGGWKHVSIMHIGAVSSVGKAIGTLKLTISN